MTRLAVVLVLAGVAGCLALAVLALGAGAPVMPSYLAAWLLVLAVPLGALPLVMVHDLAGGGDPPVITTLRALLPLTVIVAALAVPVLAGLDILYPTAAIATPLRAAWMAPAAVLTRSVVVLVVWIGLAVVFARAPASRPASVRAKLAGLGLVLHLVMGTIAAQDWAAAVDPGLNSSSFGLLVLVGQSGVALSVACLADARARSGARRAMLLLLGAWLFLHFTQYLVVWSANLPDEVTWYLTRDAGLGAAAEAAAIVVALLALALGLRRGAGWIAATAALILLLHLTEMVWLVVPASRGAFTLQVSDLAALVGLLGLIGGLAVVAVARKGRAVTHGLA